MKRKARLGCYLLCFVGIMIMLMSIPSYSAENKTDTDKEVRRIAAKVNGSPVYEDQVRAMSRKELESYRKYGTGKISPKVMNRLWMKALQSSVDQEILLQESKKITVSDIDSKVDEKLKEVKAGYPSEEHFKNRMSKNKVTENDLRKNLEARVYLDEYMKKNGLIDFEVPDEDIRAFYESNPRAFQREEMVKVSHIVITIQGKEGLEEKEKAREKADSIRQEVLKGKDFAESAKKYSQDGYASKGGDLGYIKKGHMPPQFDEAAFSLEKDQVSAVVETKHGFHVIKLSDRKPAGRVPYNEVRDFIAKYLKNIEGKKKLSDHMAEMRSKAKIELFIIKDREENNKS